MEDEQQIDKDTVEALRRDTAKQPQDIQATSPDTSLVPEVAATDTLTTQDSIEQPIILPEIPCVTMTMETLNSADQEAILQNIGELQAAVVESLREGGSVENVIKDLRSLDINNPRNLYELAHLLNSSALTRIIPIEEVYPRGLGNENSSLWEVFSQKKPRELYKLLEGPQKHMDRQYRKYTKQFEPSLREKLSNLTSDTVMKILDSFPQPDNDNPLADAVDKFLYRR